MNRGATKTHMLGFYLRNTNANWKTKTHYHITSEIPTLLRKHILGLFNSSNSSIQVYIQYTYAILPQEYKCY